LCARAILSDLLPIVAARAHCFVGGAVVIGNRRHPEVDLVEFHRR